MRVVRHWKMLPCARKAGWGFQQPSIAEGVTVHGKRIEPDDL